LTLFDVFFLSFIFFRLSFSMMFLFRFRNRLWGYSVKKKIVFAAWITIILRLIEIYVFILFSLLFKVKILNSCCPWRRTIILILFSVIFWLSLAFFVTLLKVFICSCFYSHCYWYHSEFTLLTLNETSHAIVCGVPICSLRIVLAFAYLSSLPFPSAFNSIFSLIPQPRILNKT
jgi:hypothetical protein